MPQPSMDLGIPKKEKAFLKTGESPLFIDRKCPSPNS